MDRVGPDVESDPVAEAGRLADLARDRGLRLRVLGGTAFVMRLPRPVARPPGSGKDIDLITLREDRRAIAALLASEGYQPDKHYNALNGHRQMYFVDPRRGRPVDVIVDRLEMCHRLELRDRLGVDYPTLSLADLLLSKLQIVELNRKDVVDVLALLEAFALTVDDATGINVDRVSAVTSHDWGWWRTVTGNLDSLLAFANQLSAKAAAVPGRIDSLRAAIETSPKSVGWRIRSRVGDRMRWYELPEEVDHD